MVETTSEMVETASEMVETISENVETTNEIVETTRDMVETTRDMIETTRRSKRDNARRLYLEGGRGGERAGNSTRGCDGGGAESQRHFTRVEVDV